MHEKAKITVAELQRLIRDKIYEAMPDLLWVIGEIAEIKVNSAGHCYLELTGSDTPGGKITARVRGTIWASKYRSLSTLFIATTGIPLRAGITVLFRCRVEYHELYGLSLNITDIDPAYTAGDMALRREATIRRLTAEGVLNMNSSLPLTPYPRNVAVVSSPQAAGYHDFIKQLTHNPYGYIFKTTLYEAVMQGEATEESVTAALDRIAEEAGRQDIVVIIRGGGSTTDLSWFDSYAIAFHVTQFPLPVVTGIGHEKDQSVTDMVAWRAFKTPTAVAGFIIERTLECENRIVTMAGTVASAVNEALKGAERQLASLQSRTAATARLAARVKYEKLQHLTGRVRQSANTLISKERERTAAAERSLQYLDPVSVIKRGFTLTSHNGTIIRSATGLKPGDTLTTHFEKEKAISIVKQTIKKR